MNGEAESLYQQGLKVANFKMAIDALKTAGEHLSRTSRADLATETRKLANKIMADAFKTLPRDLYEQLREKTEQGGLL